MGVNLEPIAHKFYIDKEKFEPNSHDVEDGLITAGTHRVLRFDFLLHNAVDEDLVVGSPEDRPDLFIWSSGHGHYHLNDFNKFDLFDAEGHEVGSGYKQGFCLMDSVQMDSWASADSQFTDCNVSQGISAGWADLYRADLPGQYVAIDGLPDGKYTLQATTNYLGVIDEDNYADNTISVGLNIHGNNVTEIPPPYDPLWGA